MPCCLPPFFHVIFAFYLFRWDRSATKTLTQLSEEIKVLLAEVYACSYAKSLVLLLYALPLHLLGNTVNKPFRKLNLRTTFCRTWKFPLHAPTMLSCELLNPFSLRSWAYSKAAILMHFRLGHNQIHSVATRASEAF